jgi:hypothetical protein
MALTGGRSVTDNPKGMTMDTEECYKWGELFFRSWDARS